jgi:hypothetical protein
VRLIAGSAENNTQNGGDRGELNSLSVKSPVWLVLKLLDQIVGLGETAKKITENIKDNGHQPQGTIG